MEENAKDILSELLDKLQKELSLVNTNISENEIKISELNKYIDSFLEKEDKDFKYFSPRNVESVYKDEIEKSKAAIASLLSEIDNLNNKKDELLTKIDKLTNVSDTVNNSVLEEDFFEKEDNISILDIQEMDRQRIARELHDGPLQNLAHLIHKIELASLYIDTDPIRAKIELSLISNNIRSINDDIRCTIFDLRPMTFDDLGFKDTILRLLDIINEENKYNIESDISEFSSDNNLVLVTMYRVIQECLYNIDKHAKADTIIINCKMDDDYYYIHIEDNGIGFTNMDVHNKGDNHFGLKVLKERIRLLNGIIEFDSHVGVGTKIEIKVPVI